MSPLLGLWLDGDEDTGILGSSFADVLILQAGGTVSLDTGATTLRIWKDLTVIADVEIDGDLTVVGGDTIVPKLIVRGQAEAESFRLTRNELGSLDIVFGSTIGKEAGIRFTESSDEVMLYVKDTNTQLRLFDGGVEVRGGLGGSDGTLIAAEGITLEDLGFGIKAITFADPDPGEQGRITYDPDLDSLYFDVGGATAPLTVQEDGVTVKDIIHVRNDSGPTGRLMATALGNLIISNEAGHSLYFRPNGSASGAREITWHGTSTSPQFRDVSGTLRDLAYIREGTWTPALNATSSSPSVGYSSRGGYYRRIGDLVFVSGVMLLSSISGGSGSLVIDNLPYNCLNTGFARPHFHVMASNITYPTGRTSLVAMLAQNQNYATIYSQGNGVVYAAIAPANVANNSQVWFSGFYITGDS